MHIGYINVSHFDVCILTLTFRLILVCAADLHRIKHNRSCNRALHRFRKFNNFNLSNKAIFLFIEENISYGLDRLKFLNDDSLSMKPRKLFQCEIIKSEIPNTAIILVE